MKRRVFSILFVLLLVLSLSLVTAVPAGAQGAPIGDPFFTTSNEGTVEWSTEQPNVGEYSAKLYIPPYDPLRLYDEARVVFNYGGDLNSITGVSYPSYVIGGNDGTLYPSVVLAVDIDDDPEVDAWVVQFTPLPNHEPSENAWETIVFDDNSPVHVAGDRAELGALTGQVTDRYAPYTTDTTGTDTLGSLKAESGWGEFTVLEVKVFMGAFTNLTQEMTAYVDDITINGVTYALEPEVATLTIVEQPTETTAGAVITPPVTVKAEDGSNNAIPGQSVTASLQAGEGTLSGVPTQVTDDSGIATFDDLSIDLIGGKVLRFTADSVTVDSSVFMINPSEPISLVIKPGVATITAGDDKAYTSMACDAYGNWWVPTAVTAFSIEEGAGGSWYYSEYTSEFAGTWTVTGTYGGLTEIATLTVEPDVAVSIVISPDEATNLAGDWQAYTAEATDAYGNSFSVTSDTDFSVEDGAGGYWSEKANNLYYSEFVGTWVVTGTYDGFSDTAILTVEPETAASIVVSPDTATITAGDNIIYIAMAYDWAGNEVGDVTADTTFSIQAGAFGSWDANVYTSQFAGIWTVTGSYGGFTDTATLTVFENLLPLKAGWTLISTDREVDTESSAFIGATLVLKYTASGFLSATFADLKPVEALYVKMPDGGWVGLNYLDVVPGVSAKDLIAGWNLVSCATPEVTAAAVLSPLRYVQVGEEQGIGLTTLVSQGSYNWSGANFYVATLTDADWEALARILLNPFDGYWVYMNAAKSFGVIPSPVEGPK